MGTNTHYNPDTVVAPFGSYHHAVEIAAGVRSLHFAAQVGADRDGNVAPDAATQTELIFENIERILDAAGMRLYDLVKLNFYIVFADDLPEIRRVRDARLTTILPALSLIIVSALGRPEWRLEVDGVAARSDR